MDQAATIGAIEIRESPTALDWDARIHKVRPRLMAAGVAQPGSKQVLLAEDEPMVRDLMQKLLHSWGYRVFSARNGLEAMEIAEEHKGPIHLLVSDVTMPRMDGPELAEKLTAKRPRLQVILLSGYSHTEIVLQGGWKFIQKPFHLQELRAAVEDSGQQSFLEFEGDEREASTSTGCRTVLQSAAGSRERTSFLATALS
jgi:DNA-binding NtrC family response regulator